MSQPLRIHFKQFLDSVTKFRRAIILTGISLIATPPLYYVGLHLSRPPRTNYQQQLFQGIVYRREVRSTPRPLMIHIVTIDLTIPGIKALVTPGKPTQGKELTAQTTEDFLKQFKLQLAVNGSFFFPFHAHGPWNYYPHKGDPVNVLGQAISNRVTYSADEQNWPVLCLSAENRAQIRSQNCPVGTAQAVAGSHIFVESGKPALRQQDFSNTELFPRTAVAIDQRGEKLWIIVVDGRQSNYSEGVTMVELSQLMTELGVYQALNLDGGGSTTLVAEGNGDGQVLNAPFHTRIPMRQRPVANHLGFYAPPLD